MNEPMLKKLEPAGVSSAEFFAIRIPAVATAAISAAPRLRASSTISTIASAVRRIGSAWSKPCSSSPSPSRVSSRKPASTTERWSTFGVLPFPRL